MAEAKKKKARVELDEHRLDFAQIKERYGTSFNETAAQSSQGLTAGEAANRLNQNGPNILTPPKKVHPVVLFLECLFAVFNCLLILCAVITWILFGIDPINNFSNSYIGAILMGVSILNALIEFVQIRKSAAILDSFMNMIPAKATAVRDSALVAVQGADLVLGDVVYVKMGDKCPADLYVFFASDMKVDNSSLTGESDPQPRTVGVSSFENPLEALNLAFNGSLVISGDGYGVVIRCGDNTVIGQIAGLTGGEKKRPSPLTVEINRLVIIMSTLAITSAVAFFLVSYFRSGSLNTALAFAIGILIAWVPQGLPATVTMLLSIAAKRMATKNVLVKDLKGVETLGGITMLATDKTGTLTKNQMTVTYLWTSETFSSATSSVSFDAAELQEKPFNLELPGIRDILYISALCTRARFDKIDVPVDQRQILGDATESGLLRYTAKILSNIDELGGKYPKVFEIPFNSETKWHMSIHKKAHANGKLTLYMKGAPERVFRACQNILWTNGEPVPVVQAHKDAFQTTYENMAGKGHRVLAFAQLLLPESEYPVDYAFDKEAKNYPTTGFCFVGLVSLEDPPKHGVREAIGHCREAGIKVMMVTGDHPLTAEAIGRKINLMLSDTKERIAKRNNVPVDQVAESDVNAIVIHGESIDGLTEADWDNIFSKDEIIFARTSPKHKLQIVKRAQSIGHLVGVTGDGVNDSPALKKADLGIAMNQSGSDVSKEAAAMILLDDNFASIVQGITEGRLIFYNLKKSIRYVITHIVPEVLPYLFYAICDLPIAIGGMQILVVDLGFELLAALSYAFEPPETPTGLMKLLPRRPVSAESIELLRERHKEDIHLGLAREKDPEKESEDEEYKPSFGVILRSWFSPTLWRRAFAKSAGEVLVDTNAMLWMYIEAPIFEYVGCQTAFFLVLYRDFGITPSESVNIQRNGGWTPEPFVFPNGYISNKAEALARAQSAYYFGLFLCQSFNLFACKCLITLPFGKYPLQNRFTWITLVAGALFAGIIVYVPPINLGFFTSYQLLPLYWLVPMATGLLLVFYSGLRFAILRRLKPMSWSPDIQGLRMHPTRWSTGR
ncbi:P-type cation-transporting ATPase [Cladochytrium replicatum]|nr:P-type cation-transporting ATPase [Cladochytrium replicatum]